MIRLKVILLFFTGTIAIQVPNLAALAQGKIESIENKQEIISFGGYIALTVVLLAVITGFITIVTVVVKLTTTVNAITANNKEALATSTLDLTNKISVNKESILILKSETKEKIAELKHALELLTRDVQSNKTFSDQTHLNNARRINNLEHYSAKTGYTTRTDREVLG